MTPQQQIEKLEAILKGTLKKLPRKVGKEVVRYSNQRFREQGWDGVPWQKRKNPNSKQNKGRALLIQSGKLRRSIRIIEANSTTVTVGTNLPYAKVHNEGYSGTQTVQAHTRNIKYKAHYSDLSSKNAKGKYKTRTKTQTYESKVQSFTRRMRTPKRQFIGDSPYMRRNLVRIVQAEFNTELKPFIK